MNQCEIMMNLITLLSVYRNQHDPVESHSAELKFPARKIADCHLANSFDLAECYFAQRN
jgi:hypothetical protein